MTDDSTRESASRRINRRNVLKTAGVATLTGLAGCSGGGDGESGSGGQPTDGGSTPTETAGSGGTTGTAGSGTVELDMWLGYITESSTQRKYTEDLVARAEEQFDVSISITGVAYSEFAKEFRSASAAGDLPHLVDLQTNPEVLAGGLGRPIKDLFEGSKTAEKVSDRIVEPMRVWGKQLEGERTIIGWPLGIRPHFPIWRMDWLEQAGISRGEVSYKNGSNHYIDDLPAIYQALNDTDLGRQQGYFPSATGMKQSDAEYADMYIPQFGGSLTGVVNEEGTAATIDSQAARDAFRMQFDYIDKGYFDGNSIGMGDEETTSKQFAGKLAENQLQDNADIWSSYREQQPQKMKNLRYAFSVPHNAGTKATFSWYVSIGFIGDAFDNQNQLDTAAKFVDWWATDAKNVLGNAQKMGIIPANPDVIQSNDWFGQTKLHEEFWRGVCTKTFQEFEQATVPAVPGGTAIVYEIPARMYQKIHQGTSIEQATSTAAEEINSVLAEHDRR